MKPLPSDRHRRYAPTLAVATLVAAGLMASLLAFAPAPSLRPYELRAVLAPSTGAHRPLQLMSVETIADDESAPGRPEGPLADLEPESWFELAAVDRPREEPARPPVVSPRFDFQPITRDMLATQALFRMQPVFDELPRDLALDRVVVVKVRVTDEGHVVEARVAKGIDRVLDQQALQAAWHYRLAKNDEGERPGWVTLPYEFLDRP